MTKDYESDEPEERDEDEVDEDDEDDSPRRVLTGNWVHQSYAER